MTIDDALLLRVTAALGWRWPGDSPAAFAVDDRLRLAAWLRTGDGCLAVIEAMRAKGYCFMTTDPHSQRWVGDLEPGDPDTWDVQFWKTRWPEAPDEVVEMYHGDAPTLPEAVILAAARALGVE